MTIERPYGVAINKNGSASTTIQSSTFGNVPANCLMVAGIILGDDVSITAPAGWSTLLSTPAGGSYRQAGIFYRFARNGDAPNYQFTPTFGGSVLAATNIGCFLGVDETNPFADYGATGDSSADSLPGPSLNIGRADSVGVWWWAVHFTRSASGRPVTNPGSVTVNGGPSGTANTSTASSGVNMNSGYELFPASGGSTGTRTASVSVQGTWAAAGCLLQPGAGGVITGGFLPFFGR